MLTLADAITHTGTDVLDHLDRQASVGQLWDQLWGQLGADLYGWPVEAYRRLEVRT